MLWWHGKFNVMLAYYEELLAVDALCDHKGNYHILELNGISTRFGSIYQIGSAIGIKSQFWKEDSESIVELTLDKMNKVFCPKSPITSSEAALMQSSEEWLKHNAEREKQI